MRNIKIANRRRPTDIGQHAKTKRQRLEATYGSGKVRRILKAEAAWRRQAEASALNGPHELGELLRPGEELRNLIDQKAKKWAAQWRNKRLPQEDFISVFMLTAWRIIVRYSWAKDFYLYETIEKALDKRAIDVYSTRRKRNAERCTRPKHSSTALRTFIRIRPLA